MYLWSIILDLIVVKLLLIHLKYFLLINSYFYLIKLFKVSKILDISFLLILLQTLLLYLINSLTISFNSSSRIFFSKEDKVKLYLIKGYSSNKSKNELSIWFSSTWIESSFSLIVLFVFWWFLNLPLSKSLSLSIKLFINHPLIL